MPCVLCHSDRTRALDVQTPTSACLACELIFVHPAARLDRRAERERYELHRADDADEGYRRFTAPLREAIAAATAAGARGLDFGAGRVPVLARALEAEGRRVTIHDPIFRPNPAALDLEYDFVVACEVVEHLYDPAREFARLRRCLAPGGSLWIMTEPWLGGDFARWYYRRDPTHVCFYTPGTFRWIAARFGFKNLSVQGRIVRLDAPGGFQA